MMQFWHVYDDDRPPGADTIFFGLFVIWEVVPIIGSDTRLVNAISKPSVKSIIIDVLQLDAKRQRGI
jgi:hypothetical protein